MQKKIGLILSIREKASRLPGKVLKQIHGKTTTEILIDRMKSTKNFDKIIIGTSIDPRDKVFKDIANSLNVECFFGDPEDKLNRYHQICNAYDLYGVVIVDGDDILCFPDIMDQNAELLRTTDVDVVFWKNLPLGAASSALTRKALDKVMEIKSENDTEVWGGYFTQSKSFNIRYEKSDIDLYNHPEIRMTLDYEEDYYFLCQVFDKLEAIDNMFSSLELMELLINTDPLLNGITAAAQLKYEEHIAKAAPVKFKNK
ncbi:MAG: hypothetical protein JXR65_07240 [Bacteroidales bacterium]|nr:hypothetical protein [Bacteroidales bacterium]